MEDYLFSFNFMFQTSLIDDLINEVEIENIGKHSIELKLESNEHKLNMVKVIGKISIKMKKKKNNKKHNKIV